MYQYHEYFYNQRKILIFVFVIFISFNRFGSAKISDCHRKIAIADNNEHFLKSLRNILKPRVVGSQGHQQVGQFIINELGRLGFSVELDRFATRTPLSNNLTFTNIIGKSNPNAENFITLACHYDSKYFPKIPNFVGAVDSAVPCAILLNLVKTLSEDLEKIKTKNEIGLMLIFFDGEEAFVEWNEFDSLYGSRHLAHKMSNSVRQSEFSDRIVADIDRINVFILLDLIGAANPRFVNFFRRTQHLHNALVNIERELSASGLLFSNRYMFFRKSSSGGSDDDHRPFLIRDVPILHVISTPFPPQWHKATDDGNNLHLPSIKNFNRIFRIFLHDLLLTPQHTSNLRQIQEDL